MPRPLRICIPGYPHHVVQRGNNRQSAFFTTDDYKVYLALLTKAAKEHGTSVHAYVLMTNHVHLLMTPSSDDGLSLTMQSIGRSYVRYVNKNHNRTGTLWEGRFKSSTVDNDWYCLACYRYIELNPIRAKMVSDPREYRWSSFPFNAEGRPNKLLTPHPAYQALGSNARQRLANYRSLVQSGIDESLLEEIREGARKCAPVGNTAFLTLLDSQLDRRIGVGRKTISGSDPN